MTEPASDPLIEIETPPELRADCFAREALDAFASTLSVYDLNTTKLLASELVVNAVLNGAGPIRLRATPIRLRATVAHETVRVEVDGRGDGRAIRDHDKPAAALRRTGQVLDGLASRWGGLEGTRHWFELECRGRVRARP
jgi:hypothetical protein